MYTIKDLSRLRWTMIVAYGFPTQQLADAYIATLSEKEQQLQLKCILPNGKTCVSRYVLETDFVMLQAALGTKGFKKTYKLEERPLPEGAFHTLLVVTGKQVYEKQLLKGSLPERRLNGGLRECSVVWVRTFNGKKKQLGRYNVHGNLEIALTPLARGVAYAREAIFDRCGKFVERRTVVCLIEGMILPDQQTKAEILRVSITPIIRSVEIPDPEWREPLIGELSKGWRKLINRARESFQKNKCISYPDDAWRKLFIRQLNLWNDHEAVTRFRASIENLSWQEALDRVSEPWHLEIIIDKHIWQEGDIAKMRTAPPGTLTPTRMIFFAKLEYEYECSSERRAQLEAWANNWMPYRDDNW